MNIKIFFVKKEEEWPNLTYNHYGIVKTEPLPGNWLRLIKKNEEEALINMDNVNQIITI